MLRDRRIVVREAGAILERLPPRTYELFELVHRVSTSSDALTNRNHFPHGCGIAESGEYFVPTRGVPPEDMTFVVNVLRTYARDGAIVASAVATKGKELVETASETDRDAILICVDDVSRKSWCFYRVLTKTPMGWTFGDLRAVDLGKSPIFE
jgi:hypothetical protein